MPGLSYKSGFVNLIPDGREGATILVLSSRPRTNSDEVKISPLDEIPPEIQNPSHKKYKKKL